LGADGHGLSERQVTANTQLDSTTDFRSGFDCFSADNLRANWAFVQVLQQFANRRGSTTSQVPLAWLLAQKPWIVPIPGTRSLDHFNENLAAVRLQLTAADLRELNVAASAIKVRGDRMNEMQMKIVDASA
jgi:aryl-alcohol dehydrogenase-like predicted oxidoreductase